MKLTSKDTNGDIYLLQGIMLKGSSVTVHIYRYEDKIFHILEGEIELILAK